MTGPMGWLSKVAAYRERRRADAPARRNRARGTHCFFCGVPFAATGSTQRTIDHRLPRSQGGNHRLVNMVFACQACNQRKADRPEDEFLASAWLWERRQTVTHEGWPAGAAREVCPDA
jgi:5-methylcytosine-specific restriction endonuclease McrA